MVVMVMIAGNNMDNDNNGYDGADNIEDDDGNGG